MKFKTSSIFFASLLGLIYGCATSSTNKRAEEIELTLGYVADNVSADNAEQKMKNIEKMFESMKFKKQVSSVSSLETKVDIATPVNSMPENNPQSERIYMIGDGRGIYVFRENSEDYLTFKSKTKSMMNELLRSCRQSIQKEVTEDNINEIIDAVYDSGIIFPEIADLKYVEIAKLFHESGFVKDLKHEKGEKGVGAISIPTGRGLLDKLYETANIMKPETLDRITPKTRSVLRKILSREINQKNLHTWLIKSLTFNVLCSTYYDKENLEWSGGDLHSALKAYQRGKNGTAETNYLKCVMNIYKRITDRDLPRYVITKEIKRE